MNHRVSDCLPSVGASCGLHFRLNELIRKESGSGPLVTKPVGLEVAAPPPEVKLGGPGGWASVGISDGGWPPGGSPPHGGAGGWPVRGWFPGGNSPDGGPRFCPSVEKVNGGWPPGGNPPDGGAGGWPVGIGDGGWPPERSGNGV